MSASIGIVLKTVLVRLSIPSYICSLYRLGDCRNVANVVFLDASLDLVFL